MGSRPYKLGGSLNSGLCNCLDWSACKKEHEDFNEARKPASILLKVPREWLPSHLGTKNTFPSKSCDNVQHVKKGIRV